MNFKKVIFWAVIFCTATAISQESAIYTNYLNEYNKALELYHTKAYVAAQQKFNTIKSNFDNDSELKANCEFYAANCAIKLGQPNSDELMQEFVKKNPTSTKQNSAFIDVADYYFKTGKYAYAAKWYSRVNTAYFTHKNKEDFNFKYGYALFATKSYDKAKEYFLSLLDSQQYGAQAKYYYGFMAYNQNEYETADKYLGEVAEDDSYKTEVSYYLADMNFKLGNFEKAIEKGLPLLETAQRNEHSEISKIVGESYFNLQQYSEAIPHLKNYKGKRGKWNNTDYYLLGYSYYKQNDFENAVNYFNKIIDGTNSVAQNAYYHLAECYLKLDKKQEALNAFRNASQMTFSEAIQKDAWLNYAKLSYDIGNPYKSVPDVLKEYLNQYPNAENKNEINDLIISSYITSNDFKGALNYLENKKNGTNETLYQQVAYYRAIELFNEGNYNEAKAYFKNSLTYKKNALITAKATFWNAETNYRLSNFNDALDGFTSFKNLPEASKTEEFNTVNYNLAYTFFKLKEYNKAINSFKNYASEQTDEALLNDCNLRLADCYFATRNYSNAVTYYNKVTVAKTADADYAQFQKAISYGLTGDANSKINELKSFLNQFKKSSYQDDALYVLGNSYIEKNETGLALESFNTLISNFKRSPLVSKSMLKKGLIYYNTDENNKALTTYKSIVTQFPKTAEALQAVKNIRQIYVDTGNVDEYANWVKTVNYVNVSNAELDNDTYESAEKQYLQNNHLKAIASFKKYLSGFPDGLHTVKAHFYLAQLLFSENKLDEAATHYTSVLKEEQNEFTETALQNLALIHLKNTHWKEAIPILERLEKETDNSKNITFAQSNLMKGYYELKNYEKAVNYAEKVLSNTKIEDAVKSDAHVIIARSAIKTNQMDIARNAYKDVEKIASGELKAEALYYSAFFENEDGSYRVSNEIVQKIASDYAAYKYWASKGLVVMAKNYYQLNDAYQATYILESVIKNFPEFEEVTEEAKKELNLIKTQEAKTNESVKQ